MRICGRCLDTGDVETWTIEAGRLTARAGSSEGADLGGADVWLAPGFLDIQVNGYGGADFNRGEWQSAEEIAPIFAAAARAGTPLLCPTLTTNSFEAFRKGFETLARAVESERAIANAVPCFHLEGPYIADADGPRGAHPREHTRNPDWDEFMRWQEAAGGRIGICTLAPERPGALRFIERLVEAGIVAAIGHTGAESEDITDAVRAGASLSTHLGNAAHGMLPRHPNYLWEQLANDGLTASVIADGHHLPPSVVKCMARAKTPERLVAVSDAVALGGMPAGIYDGGRHEVLPTGKITLAGTPYLAGAGHLLDTCVANLVRFAGLSLAEAVRCASAVPARVLGLEGRKGRIEVGYDADLTLFRDREDGPLEIAATIRAGEAVYQAK